MDLFAARLVTRLHSPSESDSEEDEDEGLGESQGTVIALFFPLTLWISLRFGEAVEVAATISKGASPAADSVGCTVGTIE